MTLLFLALLTCITAFNQQQPLLQQLPTQQQPQQSQERRHEQKQQPNVVMFVVDDGGFESPVWGNPTIQTPYISHLADVGTSFHRAYTAVSSCSPSRSAILSGLPTHQNGMYGLHQAPGNFESSRDITSLPNLFNLANYKTGLVGKYHVGPLMSYNFTYGINNSTCWGAALSNPFMEDDGGCVTDYNAVTRNLTVMKLNARTFLRDIEPQKPFLLYVGFGDTHRCDFRGVNGSFCELYGSGRGGQGIITDWTPHFYSPADVQVPSFLPDNAAVREDIAAQYTAWDRLDQGVGVILAEVEAIGATNSTLVVFFSDNGIPFPAGKTNLLETGQRDPLIIYSPKQATHGRHSSLVVSALDLLPTLLDWAGISYPTNATAQGLPASLTGSSLLPLLDNDPKDWRNNAFGSHSFHSLYAYYPTRSFVTQQYRLVHNLNYNLKFAILEDVWSTQTWQDIMAAGEAGNNTGWRIDYNSYMFRPEWQLFDIQADPIGLNNLANVSNYSDILMSMKQTLRDWRAKTNDPWLPCNPGIKGDWLATHSEICSF